MADPEPSLMPALAPLVPSTSRPVCVCRPAKGKEPEVLVDPPPHLKAKASGSLRGMRQHVLSPASVGLQDVDKDAPGTSELPGVQVEHPLSQQCFKHLQVCSESIAIGDVSLTSPYHLHLLTTLLRSLWALPNIQHR